MTKIELLKEIIAATDGPNGFMAIAGTDDAKSLSQEGHIEVNPSVPGLPENHVAARVTDQGRAFASQQTQEQPQQNMWGSQPAQTNEQAQTQTQPEANKGGAAYVVVSGIGFAPSAPAKREGVKREAPEKYPFGNLQAPTKNADGSINYENSVLFVPSNKDKAGKLRTPDEMAFSLQSACAAAGRRYSKELPSEGGRKKYDGSVSFKTQATTHNGVPGAYIYREFKA